MDNSWDKNTIRVKQKFYNLGLEIKPFFSFFKEITQFDKLILKIVVKVIPVSYISHIHN